MHTDTNTTTGRTDSQLPPRPTLDAGWRLARDRLNEPGVIAP